VTTLFEQTPAAPATVPAAGARPLPDHGTLSRAKIHNCKCTACDRKFRDYMNTRTRLIAYGRWQPYVDAEPVRAHVLMLSGYGIGRNRVRDLAGVPGGTMSKLLYGDRARGMVPSKRVRAATADKILAVKPTLDTAAPTALVDATGTRRRLQALVAVGWPQAELGRRLGVDKKTCNEQVNAVVTTSYAATALAVRSLYNQLWDQDPTALGVEPRWAAEARATAIRRGWAPPAAWDDDYIDSPAATPDLGDHVDRYTAIAEDALWLINTQGYTREQAAHRLGITGRHLDRALAHDKQVAR
jgi:DNA-binding XRE family transcriptional regulator